MEVAADLEFGLAGSVGPVPFVDASEAVDFTFRLHGRFPTVPVVTAPDASLLAQAVSGLPRVAPVGEGLGLTGTPPTLDDAATAGRTGEGAPFDALRLTAQRLAVPDEDVPAVAVRLPVLGPVTLSTYLHAAGVPLQQASELASATVAARAVTMLQVLLDATAAAPDATPPVIAVVLSEPALVGSMHPTYPLLPGQVRATLDPVVDALDCAAPDRRLLIGVHVPGACDWPTVVGSGASLLCLPVDRSILGWAPLFGDLLARGGRICWGAVPVDRPFGSSVDPHWRHLVGLWTGLVAEGVDPMLLRLRSSFSPADGLGHFGRTQAELVMDLTVALATRVRHQAVAARLSLGA